jgi:uncharacterized Zn finger protein (UPF0148 family)
MTEFRGFWDGEKPDGEKKCPKCGRALDRDRFQNRLICPGCSYREVKAPNIYGKAVKE